MRTLANLPLFALSLVIVAAKCNDTRTYPCDIQVTVIDKTGLDGCGILLRTDDGRELLPTNAATMPTDLMEGDIARITYRELDDYMSICMAEDAAIELTCFTPVKKPRKAPCNEIVDPYDSPWALPLMKQYDPKRLIRHDTGQEVFYQFDFLEGDVPSSAIYSCHGEFQCTFSSGRSSECEDYLASEENRTIIYIVDN